MNAVVIHFSLDNKISRTKITVEETSNKKASDHTNVVVYSSFAIWLIYTTLYGI